MSEMELDWISIETIGAEGKHNMRYIDYRQQFKKREEVWSESPLNQRGSFPLKIVVVVVKWNQWDSKNTRY